MVQYSDCKTLNTELARLALNRNLHYQVGGDGPLSARVVVVGEAPGTREVEASAPFVGSSGSIMWKCLKDHCGLTRMDVYTTNVAKRQSAITSGAKDAIPITELRLWEEILQYELRQLPNVRYIILMGNYALQAMLGEKGIGNWRGSVVYKKLPNGFDGAYMCMYNPAMILREAKFQPIFQLDMKKLNKVLNVEYRNELITHRINPTFNEAFQWCEKMIDERLPVSFDIETLAYETACVGFANSPNEGMCINFRTESANRFSVNEEMRLYQKINQVLTHPRVKLVAQNGNFDSYWLWYKDRIKVKPLWFDTMLAHHTLYPTLPHSLAFLTSQYTNHPYYKDDGKLWKEKQVIHKSGIDSFWRYNVKDVCITLACQKMIERELVAQRMETFFYGHVMRLQPHLVKMTVLGVKCDVNLKHVFTDEITQDVANMKADFTTKARLLTNDPTYEPNPGSPKQMNELFYDKLKLPSSGGKSIDVTNRTRLLALPTLPDKVGELLQLFNKYAQENKFLGTYAKMEIDEDDRIRCVYKQTGVQSAPGRLSSEATLWGSGSNLQNQPTRAQKMFIADEGYEFSYTDGSQAEARVVAVLWKVKGLLENFELARSRSGFDVHRANAARIFKKPYEQIPEYDRDPVTDAPTHRFLGKRCVHGLNYRMQPAKLAETCEISMGQASEAYFSYHRAFPEIKQAWSATIEEIRRNGMLFTPLGRRLILLGINPYTDDEAMDSIIAFKPQSTIGDHVSRMIYLCEDDSQWPKTARICLNIHDALIALNRIEDGPTVRAIMKKYGELTIPSEHGNIDIPFEVKHSTPDEYGVRRWSTMEKIKEIKDGIVNK